MDRFALPELLLLTLIVWAIYASRRGSPQWRQLGRELGVRMPVFSAQITNGKEAEFIRERLPKRFSLIRLALAALLLAGVALWRWLG
jgi:hypothetical protein